MRFRGSSMGFAYAHSGLAHAPKDLRHVSRDVRIESLESWAQVVEARFSGGRAHEPVLGTLAPAEFQVRHALQYSGSVSRLAKPKRCCFSA